MISCSSKQALRIQLIFAILPAWCPVISVGVNSAFSVVVCM